MNFEALSEGTPFSPEEEAMIRQVVLDRAPSDLAALEDDLPDTEAFAYLPRAAAAAFHLERFAEAAKLANYCLVLTPSFIDNWNYGNAIHVGHTVLGLLALDQGNVNLAVQHLMKSGETPGSPQLDSFGPTMQLAKALVRHGEVDPVLKYLQQCRSFWKMGGRWLDLWEPKVRKGEVPNCFQHSYV